MLRVLIADDHAITREGLKRILTDHPEAVHVGNAANAAQTLSMVRKNDWDLVLLDISLPDKSGLEVLKSIKKDRPALPVLVLSMYPVDQYALRVLKAGGSGYLTKESAPEQLLAAVRKVSEGGRFITPELAEHMARELAGGTPALPHESLSDREFEVLRLIASGRTPTEIAGHLSLSVKTISTYRTRLLHKMGMRHNAELTHYAISNRLVF
ncbi:MAG TPA: response regulator transcription factor [Burkholderiales bacterium]|jgi:DNA-binding NarL/FixJ family response regulator|nr:response regulator transcription factor [Burkholderiales bacterium]